MADSNSNKLLLMAVSLLSGVVLTGTSMVVRGDFLGKREAQAVEQRLNTALESHKKDQNWVNQLILQDLRDIKNKLDTP